MQNNETDKTIETIMTNLQIVRELEKEIHHDVEELEQRLNIARGTGDVSEQAAAAVAGSTPAPEAVTASEAVHPAPAAPVAPKPAKVAPAPRPATPRQQVERALRGHSLNVAQIVKSTGLPIGKVAEAIRALRAEKAIANVGTEDFPCWTARIGDKTDTPKLIAEVERLIMERPMTMQELTDVTGARMPRVSGAVVALQRDESRQLLNLGHGRKARWFLVAPGVRFARLAPKGHKETS